MKYQQIQISRRSFLKGLAVFAVTSGVSVPAFSLPREPYVQAGQVVNYIGPCPGGFIGGQIVELVGEWDDAGYLVETRDNCYGQSRVKIYYDTDLSHFRSEVPDRFWHNPKNKIYPNVHAYVRVKRYGESVDDAIKKMNLVLSKSWLNL